MGHVEEAFHDEAILTWKNGKFGMNLQLLNLK
jgi:hypothetical protein